MFKVGSRKEFFFSSTKFKMSIATQLRAIIDKFAPRFYLQSDEKYFPSSIDWFFERSNLVHNKVVIDTNVTSQKLYDFTQKNYPGKTGLENLYVVPKNKEVLKGQKDLKNVPIYAFVRETPEVYKIYYIVFFPFNLGKNVLFLQQAGDHDGDLEHITVEVSKKNQQLVRVHYGAHGTKDGRWVNAADVPMENNKIVGYIAYGGHGIYPAPGYAFRLAGLANDFMDKGIEWNPKVDILTLQGQPGFTAAKDGWMYFAGRLGDDGISSISDKGWFHNGDLEPKDLKAPRLYTYKSLTWFRTSVIAFILAIMIALIGVAWWQKRMYPQNYFLVLAVVVVILAILVKRIISMVA